MKSVGPIFLGLVIGALAIFTAYYFRDVELNFIRVNILPPCSTPLAYKIGTIDPKFGLSQSDIEQKLATAVSLWNKAASKEVLVYDPNNPNAMPVNFVYDARQQTISVGTAIDSTEASQAQEHAQILALQQQYQTAQASYASAVDALNAEGDAYASEVRRVNASGGADQATFDRLNAEKATLAQKQQELQAQGVALQSQSEALKARIDAYNQKVGAINKIVQNFNSTAGGDFEEGQFTQDVHGKHIDIYAYKDQSELLHSLAHEFGHSLGLPHNQNPVSIMFPYNKSSVTLSADDRAALKVACKL